RLEAKYSIRPDGSMHGSRSSPRLFRDVSGSTSSPEAPERAEYRSKSPVRFDANTRLPDPGSDPSRARNGAGSVSSNEELTRPERCSGAPKTSPPFSLRQSARHSSTPPAPPGRSEAQQDA